MKEQKRLSQFFFVFAISQYQNFKIFISTSRNNQSIIEGRGKNFDAFWAEKHKKYGRDIFAFPNFNNTN